MSADHDRPSSTLYWRLQLAGWGGCALLGFIFRWLMLRSVPSALLITLLQEPVGLAISCLLRELYRRSPAFHGPIVGAVTRAIAVSVLAAVINIVVVHAPLEWLVPRHSSWPTVDRWLMRTTVCWLIFSGWSLLYFCIKAELHARSNREAALRARQAALLSELNLLRSQLDPHFLFNSLNGIGAEIPVHPDRALEMTRELADYLRFSIEHRDHATVPLKDELAAMAAYLRIEQARFGADLQVQMGAANGAALEIPAFTLQPLVENAVKHSYRTSPPPWQLAIGTQSEPDRLTITVRNRGLLSPAEESPESGVGLELLRRRLALLYPSRHRFSLSQDGEEVVATLVLEGLPCV